MDHTPALDAVHLAFAGDGGNLLVYPASGGGMIEDMDQDDPAVVKGCGYPNGVAGDPIGID